MEREQTEEFDSIRESAFDALRLGSCIGRHRSDRLCQLLTLPSFENPVSWDILRLRSWQAETQARLYRTCWRMDLDSQAMSSPVERMKHPRPFGPTLESDWVPIDAPKVEAIISRIGGVQIPLMPASARVGLDGTNFELTVGDFFCNARISWWCDLPKEWQALRPILRDLEQLLESTWNEVRGRSGA